jgi:hypothetical protein
MGSGPGSTGPPPGASPASGDVAPSPTPRPTGAVLGAVSGPGRPEPSPTAGAQAGVAENDESGDGLVRTTTMRDSFLASVRDAAHLDLDLDVVGTNLLLAIVLMILVGISSALFNSTLDENRAQIEGWFARPAALLRPSTAALGLTASIGSAAAASRRLSRPVRVAAILAVTAGVYGFLSPDFGLDGRSLLLFVSLMLGLGIVTYISEGGMAELGARRYRLRAGVRIFAAALSVAVVCVLLSRLVGFRPGILYGFVASFALLAPAAIGRRESAVLVVVPWFGLMGASLAALVLLVPLRAAAAGGESWLIGLLEATAAIVLVAGLEGVLFNMIPVDFMDGMKVARWNPIVWAVLFTIAAFLFWQLLLNQDGAYLDAMRQTKVIAAIGVAVFCAVASIAMWTFFRLRGRHEGAEHA